MIVDFKTGQVIPPDPIITTTQSLVKSADLLNTEGVDFANSENNDWKQILSNNNILDIETLLKHCKTFLTLLSMGSSEASSEYCDFLLGQLDGWEVSDNFTMIE